MALIKVDPSQLKSTATGFQSTGTQIKQLTGQMTQLVSTLSGQVWESAAASAYRSKFNGLNDDIQRMTKMVDEHVSDLQQMAAEYEKSESDNILDTNSLSSDVII